MDDDKKDKGFLQRRSQQSTIASPASVPVVTPNEAPSEDKKSLTDKWSEISKKGKDYVKEKLSKFEKVTARDEKSSTTGIERVLRSYYPYIIVLIIVAWMYLFYINKDVVTIWWNGLTMPAYMVGRIPWLYINVAYMVIYTIAVVSMSKNLNKQGCIESAVLYGVNMLLILLQTWLIYRYQSHYGEIFGVGIMIITFAHIWYSYIGRSQSILPLVFMIIAAIIYAYIFVMNFWIWINNV